MHAFACATWNGRISLCLLPVSSGTQRLMSATIRSPATSIPTARRSRRSARPPQRLTIGVDTAAGTTLSRIPTTLDQLVSDQRQFPDRHRSSLRCVAGELINAIAVDPINHIVFASRWDTDLDNTGIVKISYDPMTGILDPTAAFDQSPVSSSPERRPAATMSTRPISKSIPPPTSSTTPTGTTNTPFHRSRRPMRSMSSMTTRPRPDRHQADPRHPIPRRLEQWPHRQHRGR